jgi:hypothetical protein
MSMKKAGTPKDPGPPTATGRGYGNGGRGYKSPMGREGFREPRTPEARFPRRLTRDCLKKRRIRLQAIFRVPKWHFLDRLVLPTPKRSTAPALPEALFRQSHKVGSRKPAWPRPVWTGPAGPGPGHLLHNTSRPEVPLCGATLGLVRGYRQNCFHERRSDDSTDHLAGYPPPHTMGWG